MRWPVLRRAVGAASLILGAFAVGACERVDEGKSQVTVIGEAPSLKDAAAGPLTAPQAVLLQNVAQGLVRFDATGQIVPGLAERWNVSDDGLSYIFRLQTTQWSDGRRVTAQQVARLLRRQLTTQSDNPLKDTLGAVDEIKAMTDRVIEISLKAPRPNLLALFAQPEFAIVLEGHGTGPFQISPESKPPRVDLVRTVSDLDEEVSRKEEVTMNAAGAPAAVRAFLDGQTDLVLGGTFADLPTARTDKLAKNALRFDPAAGLFGLVPAKLDSPVANLELRRLLSQAIDRQAMIEALDVPALLPRATVLEPGLDGVPDPVPPGWTTIPLEQRRQELAATSNRLFQGLEKPVIRIALPNAPGARIILARLAQDWGALGITVNAAKNDERPDLLLMDVVAPSNSAAWYLRQFRCGRATVCDESVDDLLDGARNATVPAQRYALLAQAAQRVDEQQLFIPITAPIRWSLVSDRMQGFANNRFARHTLIGLRERLDRERSE